MNNYHTEARLNKPLPSQNDFLKREKITYRFLHAVDNIIMYRRLGFKSRSRIGDIIGLSQGNWSKLDKGQSYPTIEQIACLCEYWGINDSYILRGKGNLEEMTNTNLRIDALELRVNEMEITINNIQKT